MKAKPDSSVAALLAENGVADALSKLFATSFAEFAYQLLKRISNDPHLAAKVDPAAFGAVGGDAPDWLRSAYEKAQSPQAAALPDEKARLLVARNRLQRVLHERRMTQADLARALGKSATSVSRIFKSPTRSRVATLEQIARALNVELTDILGPRESAA